MFNTLLIMLGGGIGAALRYHLGRLAFHLFGTAWPWGTLAANVLGGFAMGAFVSWLALRAQGGEPLRLFFAIGLLGGFTTFSSFSLETMLMIERGEWVSAMGYALVSVVASVAALAIGMTAMRSFA